MEIVSEITAKTLAITVVLAVSLWLLFLVICTHQSISQSQDAPPVSTKGECLALLPSGSFLPCKDIEPRYYPNEWLALGITV